MLSARFLVLMYTHSYVQGYEYVVMKHLSMDSGVCRSCKSGSPRSMHEESMLQANASLSCYQMPASKLSSANMAFWTGRRFPSATKPC